MVLPSLGILDLDLLHPFLHGGKRGSLVAFPSDFSSSVLHHFGFWLGTVGSCKDDKEGDSVLLHLGAATTELSLDAGRHFARQSNYSAWKFASTDVLFNQ